MSTDGPMILREEGAASAGWFIGVMVALAFLLLVLVLVCVARRNRGGKYDVHDRELAHGRRDYPDQAFHEYTHPSVYIHIYYTHHYHLSPSSILLQPPPPPADHFYIHMYYIRNIFC